MNKRSGRLLFFEIVSLLFLPALLVFCAVFDFPRKALLTFMGAVLACIPFLLSFENQKPTAPQLMPLIILASVAAVGRILFAATPNFKPVTAVVILAGITLGRSQGFLCGALAALASNLFFGQGAWTPWQMFAWGLVGYLSGVLTQAGFLRRKAGVLVWGFLSCLIYGFLLDSWTIIGFVSPLTPGAAMATYGAGLPFTLIHALSTVLFLLLLYRPWCRIIRRMQTKYIAAPPPPSPAHKENI